MKWVFWVSAALVFYAYIGYPAWLWLRSRLFPRPVLRGTNEPFVSIVMVVRNEEKALPLKLDNLLSLDYPENRLEVVVVSDGSTDATDRILHKRAQDERVRVVLNQLSAGKASGLNDALEIAQGEIVAVRAALSHLLSAASWTQAATASASGT